MELVPFSEKWAGSETKLDLKAWYRRPSTHGGFSMCGPFPLRRHLDWTRKGFEYVTLATLEDVGLVAGTLRAEGVDLDAVLKSYNRQNGHFRVDAYLKDEQVKDSKFQDELQAKVDRFGMEAVTEMMRLQNPEFVMPEGVKERAKGKKETAVA